MRWISLGVLIAAAVLLAALWGHVPDRWITHWGLHGPDGWATKSLAAAMAPLILGAFIWLLFEALALWMARRRPGARFPPEMRAVQATVVRASGLGLSLLMAALTVALPFLHPRSALPILIAALAGLALVEAVAMSWAARRTRHLRAAGVAIPDGYSGVFYKNARDARLWVPKAEGVGWTINFAHPLAWPVMIALVGLPIAMVLLVGLGAR